MTDRELAMALRAAVRGSVRFDAATRVVYSTDASNYRHLPIGVVAPVDADDVLAALEVCRRFGAPVLSRGAGTSICGQAANTAVVLDFHQYMNQVVRIDPESATAVVQPGVVLDDLRAAARPYGLTFGPDPSTHSRCTVGGMIGNNSCGSHSIAWGKTDVNVSTLDVVTYRGDRGVVGPATTLYSLDSFVDRVAPAVRELSPLTRRVSGYNLGQLLPENGFHVARSLVGSEGTCVTVLEAEVRLVPSPAHRALAVLGFPDAYAAADAVLSVRDLRPLTIEGMDSGLIAALRSARPAETASRALPPGGGWLYVETGGDSVSGAKAAAEAIVRAVRPPSSAVITDPVAQKALWRIREDGAGIVTRSPSGGEAWPGWEDAAVPPEVLSSYLRDFDALLARHGRNGAYFGHFGEGCLHVRIDFDLLTIAGVRNFRVFLEEAADLVASYGGSLSGEHGDGQARAELLPRMYSPAMIDAFAAFKRIWDPDGMMNPGRLVDPAPVDQDLRVFVGTPTVGPPSLAFSADSGSFASATRRCVGVGKCLSADGGVMCPSYRATGEERHSTRGRSRLLFELASGKVLTDRWRSEEVREALDLCLSCKGCKSDCPVSVDMATYKSEFLHRHYAGRLRPASHYSMGFLPLALAGVSAFPGATAIFNRLAGGSVAKTLGGIAPERVVPKLAPKPFLRPTRRTRVAPPDGRPRVLLWPDTFTNYFDPSIAVSAVSVLHRLGYHVEVPDRPVCCGLTWLSTGQLDTARRVLRHSLDVLRPWLTDGVPVVGLEPSCTALLRSDVGELLPSYDFDPASVLTFAELLHRHLDSLPSVPVKAMAQVHCHQHAETGFSADASVLSALGVDLDVLDSGCCGLAGNFGFERGHYEVSMACAERKLLPAVRDASADTEILADGFSCRTQIRQASGREPVHLAQLAARGFAWPKGLRRSIM
ncbi:FAD-binding and (Fe-S)-binding domain-containing protein [Fodinicola acaciae]|uniref:FAD-binding and (Fe-S)-binding domain-containing protein n=1 Tax=Fodinicola acaciae TaxID=2681555 RepID=UPI0013D6D89B|nr:FAD-binding and (Fe-S)-binding domain-containing protein [Fodinicola acaciae]